MTIAIILIVGALLIGLGYTFFTPSSAPSGVSYGGVSSGYDPIYAMPALMLPAIIAAAC